MIRQRTLFSAVQQHLANKEYSIITGARQVGKTSLLRLLFRELQAAGESVFFLSMEDPRLLQAVDEHPENLLKFFAAQPMPILEGTQASPIYVLLDEIQYAKNPTNLLKYLFDTYEENLKIIATGSSAFYLDRTFKDSLAGRKRIFHLFPLSFEEFLSFKNQEQLNEEISFLRNRPAYVSPQQSLLTQLFYEYFVVLPIPWTKKGVS